MFYVFYVFHTVYVFPVSGVLSILAVWSGNSACGNGTQCAVITLRAVITPFFTQPARRPLYSGGGRNKYIKQCVRVSNKTVRAGKNNNNKPYRTGA